MPGTNTTTTHYKTASAASRTEGQDSCALRAAAVLLARYQITSLRRLFEEFERLSRNPGLGHQRTDLTDLPVLFRRAFPFQYLVIYRQRTPLEIIAVFHAKRDISELLSERGQAEGPKK